MQFDLGVVSGVAQDLLDGVDHARSLHRAEVHRSAVIDHFSGANRSGHNVIDVSPIADLLSIAPHHERVLPDKSARNHGYNSMVLVTPRTIHGEVPAGRCFQSVVTVISL